MERTAKLIEKLEREMKSLEVATFGSFDPTEHQQCIEYLKSGKLPSEESQMFEDLVNDTETFYSDYDC